MKFTEDPCVVFGKPSGPEPERVFIRGMWARALIASSPTPSDTIVSLAGRPEFVQLTRMRIYRAVIENLATKGIR